MIDWFQRKPIATMAVVCMLSFFVAYKVLEKRIDEAVKDKEDYKAQVKECNNDYNALQNDLIRSAYQIHDLKQSNAEKDTMLVKSAEKFDSIYVQNIKSKAEPYLKQIKKYTR